MRPGECVIMHVVQWVKTYRDVSVASTIEVESSRRMQSQDSHFGYGKFTWGNSDNSPERPKKIRIQAQARRAFSDLLG
jgi:hypothetical protein